MVPNQFFLDWQFWSTLVALLALVLSQLPPVYLLFRPKRLEVDVHARIQVSHVVGNPTVALYLSVRNTGGRELRVKGLKLALSRDGKYIETFSAQGYFETPSSNSAVLFVPFTLKPNDSWGHATNFFVPFDRQTEKFLRNSEVALISEIRQKNNVIPGPSPFTFANPALVDPLMKVFDKLFIWQPGEYSMELSIVTDPAAVLSKQVYKFTLYESDSEDLRSYTKEYRSGIGISSSVERPGVFVPLSRNDT